MKLYQISYAGLLCLVMLSIGNIVKAQTLPEDLTSGADVMAITPIRTVFLAVNDPTQGALQATRMHSEQSSKGWDLYAITPHYGKKGLFIGFFITYKTDQRF